MPTEAVTGTQQMKSGGAKKAPAKKAAAKKESPLPDVSGEDGYVEPKPAPPAEPTSGTAEAPKVEAPEPQPLADPSGNGTIQVTGPDGATLNVDGCDDDWAKVVKDIDPDHIAVKYAE